MENKLVQIAMDAGFADVRLAAHEGKAALLLFMPYTLPDGPPGEGRIGISNYYPASHQSYLVVQKLQQTLNEQGMAAELFQQHGLKQLAAAACGWIGKNTLFNHPAYGSFVCIQVLKLDVQVSVGENQPADHCGSCTLCTQACPTGAITENGFMREKCIRNYAKGRVIPVEHGRHIYQMMGCERCQAACPKSKVRYDSQHTFDIRAVLRGEHTKELKKLIGANMARRTAILNQTLFYAANNGYAGALPEIEVLLQDEFVGEAARYAYDLLIDGGADTC